MKLRQNVNSVGWKPVTEAATQLFCWTKTFKFLFFEPWKIIDQKRHLFNEYDHLNTYLLRVYNWLNRNWQIVLNRFWRWVHSHFNLTISRTYLILVSSTYFTWRKCTWSMYTATQKAFSEYSLTKIRRIKLLQNVSRFFNLSGVNAPTKDWVERNVSVNLPSLSKHIRTMKLGMMKSEWNVAMVAKLNLRANLKVLSISGRA